MSLRFKGADLRRADRSHRQSVPHRLVRTRAISSSPSVEGVARMDAQQLLAYAVGCNPDTDPFDDWWHLAGRELGGDDFAQIFRPEGRPVHAPPALSADDLVLSATAALSLAVLPPAWSGNRPRSPATSTAPGLSYSPRPSRRACHSSPAARRAPPATAPAYHRRQPHEHHRPRGCTCCRCRCAANVFVLAPSPSPPGPGCKFMPGRHAETDSDLIRSVAIVGHRRSRGTWTMAGRWKSPRLRRRRPTPATGSTARRPGRWQGRWATSA